MRNYTLNCRGYKLPLGTQSHLMGILNITPDSFSDGGMYNSLEKSIEHGQNMVRDGASIIDIGGESTRPGFQPITEDEEIQRIAPVIEVLLKELNVPLSLDTYKSKVAQFALEQGVQIINDIWGLQRDLEMASIIAHFQAPVIVMHNQDHTHYEQDIITEMKTFLAQSIELALKAGIKDENIILDPGIGFGKTFAQNLEVLARLREFNDLGYPLLLGTSRKGFIGKILDLPPQERMEGTIATTVLGISHGFDIFRVHDVKENYRALIVTDKIVRKRED